MATVEEVDVDALERAIERVWRQVASRRARTVSEAVDQLWPLGLDPEAVAVAARAGLITLAHDRQGKQRRDGRPPIGWGAPHGKRWAPYMETLSAPFEDAEGREKPLLDFSEVDLLGFEARCRTIAKGWTDRGRISRRTREALVRYGGARVRDLPEEVLRELAVEWQEAWS